MKLLEDVTFVLIAPYDHTTDLIQLLFEKLRLQIGFTVGEGDVHFSELGYSYSISSTE